MDYEGLGMAMGYRRTIEDLHARACEQINNANREIRILQARMRARAAGRTAQVTALVQALEAVAPEHVLLRPTGRTYADGSAEVGFHAVYDDPYDDVARDTNIPLVTRAMTTEERAAAAEAEVLAEPIVTDRAWLVHRIMWRGDYYRTRQGAERARAATAAMAREAVLGIGSR